MIDLPVIPLTNFSLADLGRIELEKPLLLFLISPIVLIGIYAVRRGVSRWLILSRIIILSILIVALAGPFVIATTSIKDEAPRITVISDKTFSTDLFERDTADKLFEIMKSKTPTTKAELKGIISPIGDSVFENAYEGNNIVLVSDGNNNYGRDLFDTISFVTRSSGTKVFAVQQNPVHNDASVEIAGPKNIIVGNPATLNVVVRQAMLKQAGEETGYRLDVDIDGKSVLSESYTQTEKMKIIPITSTFNALGNHRITAKITPAGEDWFNLNNVFYKSVFVVPKPKVLVVAEDTNSPLFETANTLYDTTTARSLENTDFKKYKTVIIDNMHSETLNPVLDPMRDYISGGGGLVVVGGDKSYDRGGYNNSPFESLLPIISRAGEFRGGRNIVIIIDSSGSTAATDPVTGVSVIGLNDANAQSIVRYIDPSSKVAVVAFGGAIAETELLPISSDANRQTLMDFISNVGPKGGENPTNIDAGMKAADEILSEAGGDKLIVVISDGILPADEFAGGINMAKDMASRNTRAVFVQVSTTYINQDEKSGNIDPNYRKVTQIFGTEPLLFNPDERVCNELSCLTTERGPEATPTPAPTPEVTHQFPLVAIDSNHFITRYLNLTGYITGYNEVVPKIGADELVATSGGKPVDTVWNFGLGRVASFSTDNGAGETKWASALYSGENSRLISNTINWAIGDPRPVGGTVIQAEDVWTGTPERVVITSDVLPRAALDGKPLELTRTGTDKYETSISLEEDGFHDISGYGIAANYPLEYRDIGFNDKLKSVIESNGGKVYKEGEAEGLLLADVKERSVRTVKEPKSAKEPFLLIALGLFLFEVTVRRMMDRMKK